MQRLTIVLTSLVLTSAPLLAQGAQPGGRGATRTDSAGRSGQQGQRRDTTTQDTTTRRDTAARNISTGDTLRIDSYVRYSDGSPAEYVRVILSVRSSPPDTGLRPARRARYTRADSTGRFVIDSVALGTYGLQVIPGGSVTPREIRLRVDGRPIQDILIPSESWWQRSGLAGLVTFIVLFFYIATVFATRWHHIARSITAILESEFSGLDLRLQTEVSRQSTEVQALRASIDREWKKLKDRQDEPWYWSFWKGKDKKDKDNKNDPQPPSGAGPTSRGSGFGDVLWWSRGVENAAWGTIHETERQLVAFLAPADRVSVHLLEVEAQLRELKTQPAIAIANGIKDSLEPANARDPARDQERRALLARSLQILNKNRDDNFSALMEWQNKASWLMLAAAIIIVFLAGAVGNAVLFLAGAAGGFLSRLGRALKADKVPLDYGASWATLFLSPLFGALVGWFGIALIVLLTQDDVNLLGSAFQGVKWDDATHPIALSVAFLLGFSERFFDAIVGVVDRQVRRTDTDARADDPPRLPPVQGRGGDGGGGGGQAPPPEPPAKAGGIAINLPDTIAPVQVVNGKIVLDKPAEALIKIALKTDNPEFEVKPSAVEIAVGASEGLFDVVPK